LVWHDHYGESELLNQRPKLALKLCSFFIDAVISVNENLKNWAKVQLYCKNVRFIKNFISLNSPLPKVLKANLNKSTFKYHIIQVANIRPQKNHQIAIEAMTRLMEMHSIKLHLLGQFEENDEYYQSLLKLIKNQKLSEQVEFYGSVQNIHSYLEQSDLAILSSRSEGLPVSLLEYAMAKKPVIVTDVGQCKQVVGDYAKLFPKADSQALADAIEFYLSQPDQAAKDAERLHQRVVDHYGEDKIIEEVIEVYNLCG
jgi:glycosyltransferase involved in cell wall biosynthesis